MTGTEIIRNGIASAGMTMEKIDDQIRKIQNAISDCAKRIDDDAISNDVYMQAVSLAAVRTGLDYTKSQLAYVLKMISSTNVI